MSPDAVLSSTIDFPMYIAPSYEILCSSASSSLRAMMLERLHGTGGSPLPFNGLQQYPTRTPVGVLWLTRDPANRGPQQCGPSGPTSVFSHVRNPYLPKKSPGVSAYVSEQLRESSPLVEFGERWGGHLPHVVLRHELYSRSVCGSPHPFVHNQSPNASDIST